MAIVTSIEHVSITTQLNADGASTTVDGSTVEVVTSGGEIVVTQMEGPPGPGTNVYIQPTQPIAASPYLWVQTQYGDPNGFTIWLEDSQ